MIKKKLYTFQSIPFRFCNGKRRAVEITKMAVLPQHTLNCVHRIFWSQLYSSVWWWLFSPLPVVSSLLSLSSSGTLLSDPFLLEERELRCSLCSRPLPLGECCDWLTGCWPCCDWLCCWEASIPWEPFGLGPDEVMMGRGLLAWARV